MANIYGYIRVSTKDQNEQRQLHKMMEDQFLSLLSYVADQERKKIHQRQAEGIAVAKSQGKHLGRPQLNLSTLTQKQLHIIEETFPKWKNREITGVKFMELLELKKNTFYKIVKEYEENKVATNL
ncbi:hypothetical protein LAE98_30610 [Bacillus wiedmannii]|uniref:hypothetical protein n=1 Tax=Bacillus wiedmannii TaxID=1890302 RepID=UPI001CBCB9E0|nr:hypothetical protein [Bacillus wiedmannii]MBZ4226338.1 hypothetical protein [Bacillus wiedmannii]